jgi:hypothetical protein
MHACKHLEEGIEGKACFNCVHIAVMHKRHLSRSSK